MLTADLHATAQAIADGLEDQGEAINDLPWDVDDSALVAAHAATTRAVARFLELLDGDA